MVATFSFPTIWMVRPGGMTRSRRCASAVAGRYEGRCSSGFSELATTVPTAAVAATRATDARTVVRTGTKTGTRRPRLTGLDETARLARTALSPARAIQPSASQIDQARISHTHMPTCVPHHIVYPSVAERRGVVG